jgi:hypothetical protein
VVAGAREGPLNAPRLDLGVGDRPRHRVPLLGHFLGIIGGRGSEVWWRWIADCG